jgi:hypothetical protein
MTERAPETINGPVDSAITQLIQHMEISMWACGVDPETALEVINLMMFGRRTPGPHGTVKPTPEWAKAMADRGMRCVWQDVVDRAESQGSTPRDEDARLVVLAMVRQALQNAPDTFDQVLTP